MLEISDGVIVLNMSCFVVGVWYDVSSGVDKTVGFVFIVGLLDDHFDGLDPSACLGLGEDSFKPSDVVGIDLPPIK